MQKKQRERANQTTQLRCLECRRLWIEPAERWRLYLSGDEPVQPLTYCPDCARREFG